MMNQQKAMKLEIVSQPTQECQVEQPTRDWLDLPSEITSNILYRIGIFDILLNAQKVCTAWHEICKDPAMWRVICMDNFPKPNGHIPLDEICQHAVDRSQGQLVNFTIVELGYPQILEYIANSCSQLKRLTFTCCGDYMFRTLTESLKKLPLLEELNVYETEMWMTGTELLKEGIETAGTYCPMLKTLKINQEDYRFWYSYGIGELDMKCVRSDLIAMAIGQNLHELRHLELIGNPMSNEGLKMILDGCRHLESLDLRGCLFIKLDGDLGKRCLQQIKCVKLPKDSLKGCMHIYKNYVEESAGGSFYESDSEFYNESEEESYDESEEESYDESEGGSDDEFERRSDEESDNESEGESDEESDDESEGGSDDGSVMFF